MDHHPCFEEVRMYLVQEIPCNICGNTRPQSMLRAADQKTGDPRHHLRLVRCEECDLVYLSPRPDPQIAAQYFREVYTGVRAGGSYHRYYHDGEGLRTQWRRRLDWIGSPEPGGNRLLDIGAGGGHFVHVARQAGWDAEGVELDREAVRAARDEYGITLHCGRLEDISLPHDHYDLVTLWDLIEHVNDPAPLVYLVTRPDGRIIVRTANIASWQFGRDPRRWDMLFSGHLFYFSPTSLTRLLIQAGFSDIRFHDSHVVDTGMSSPEVEKLPRRIRNVARRPWRIPAGLWRELRRWLFIRRHPEHHGMSVMIAEARRPK
jgi:hypothetical protein